MHHTDVRETKIQFELILLERISIMHELNVRKGKTISSNA